MSASYLLNVKINILSSCKIKYKKEKETNMKIIVFFCTVCITLTKKI